MPMNWGCPSINIRTPVVGSPPIPLIVICPAAPVDTPKPVIPRSVTNKPGTRPLSTGSKADSLLSEICSRVTIETAIGTLFLLTFTGVPVITTSSRFMVSFSFASVCCEKPQTDSPTVKIKINNCFFIIFTFVCY